MDRTWHSRSWRNIRGLSHAILLGVAVYLITVGCLTFPLHVSGISAIWLVNGVPLAVLMRAPQRRWPALVIAAFLGYVLAVAWFQTTDIIALLSGAVSNSAQYVLCAAVLRKRLPDEFDIVDIRHVAWLVGATVATTVLRVGAGLATALLLNTPHDQYFYIAWVVLNSLGTLVSALAILALTARDIDTNWKFRPADYALCLVIVVGLFLVLGPLAVPIPSFLVPFLLILSWRRGLFGAGIANLICIGSIFYLVPLGGGVMGTLAKAGYSAAAREIYLEFFLVVSLLMTIPVAMVRARQHTMEQALRRALAASEERAIALADSEAVARGAELRLRTIIETSTDLICTLDGDGRFLEISDNCEAIWGWRRSELIGRRCMEFIHPDERGEIERAYTVPRRGAVPFTNPNRYVRPDGSFVPMFWSVAWLEEEHVLHCVGRDMTEYHALEARAALAQRMESIGLLTGGIAHDFNNLLTIVIGSSETLAARVRAPDLRGLAQLMLKAGRQGADLTRQLLAFGRRQHLAPCAFDLTELVEVMTPLIRRALPADIALIVRRQETASLAYADPSQTESAILNLCLNARDAMPHGGTLIVETANVRPDAESLRLNSEARDGEYSVLTITDNGTGIDPANLERIFDPFFTTKGTGEGTGMGLSMVYGFVRQSQGFLDVASTPGAGSRFAIHLPAASADQARVMVGTNGATDEQGGDENVLIVEDNDLVRENARRLFESLGYTVVAVPNAQEAVEVLESRDDIDLLFTDVVMPGALNGRELGELALQRWPWMRVLYTSGYPQDVLTKDGRLVEGVRLLSKPYSKAELATKVRAALEELL